MAGPRPAVRQQLLDATYECVARWGLAKTTVGDAAREAGVSRATVYRYFPGGRDELMAAVVAVEYERFFRRLYEEVHQAASIEEVLERGLPLARQAVDDHLVLQRMLRTEPDVLLPRLTVESQHTRGLIAQFLQPFLERHELRPGVDPAEAARFLARMVLSYIGSPGRADLTDPAQLSRVVRHQLLAGIVPDRPA